MKLIRPSVSLVLLALTSACAADAESELVSGLDDLRFVDKTDQVCEAGNQVAYSPSGPLTCDSIGPWVGEPLFDGAFVPEAMQRYCRYSLDEATPSHVGWLRGQLAPEIELASDCRAVAPQGDAISAVVHDELDGYFAWNTGRVSAAAFDSATADISLSPVVVSVVDTYPHDEPSSPRSDHGPVMMSFIESIACPMNTCDVSVEARLGLPRTEDGINETEGGVVGLQSDLAHGVREAVDENPGSRLIINLSVGWESDLFGGTGPNDMPPPVRAVYDTIRYARCNGALIIAAAGNSTGLTDPEVPLAPGRWEGMPVPTGSECVADFGMDPADVHVDNAPYAPLVHAVGGLYGAGSEMATSREYGMPRLAAAASHAIAFPRTGFTEPQVRTGTSVSTAVASAAASLVWAINPGLSPSRVMARLYANGRPTGMTSDFGGPALPVQRIDVCKALKAEIPGSALSCGGTPPHTQDIVAELLPISLAHTLELEDPFPCGGEIFHRAAGETRGCPELERDPWAWLTSPQPPKPGCADCVLTTSPPKPTAILTLDDEYATDTLVSADVVVTEDNGDVHRFSLGEKDLVTGEVIVNLRTGDVDHYELPLDLEGALPARSMVYMKFLSGIETEDAMLID